MSKSVYSPLLLFVSLFLLVTASIGLAAAPAAPEFITVIDTFPQLEEAAGKSGIMEKISFRASHTPFLLVATILFFCAIVHTFFAIPITNLANRIEQKHQEKLAAETKRADGTQAVSFKATMLHFLGEVEAVFGIWAFILLVAMFGFYGTSAVESYISGVNFTEPLFVVIIMALASTRPVLEFAERCLHSAACLGKGTPTAWWLSILTIGPLMGSLITEPGAITIAAMLLAKRFYNLKPSPKFAYATLGLLFVNISVGGVLTNFAAPPVLMVAQKWGLSSMDMLLHFGDKAILGIVVATIAYFLFFRKELKEINARAAQNESNIGCAEEKESIPGWVTGVHLFFMLWTVFFAHYPALFIGGFLFFLAFHKATIQHQDHVHLRGPILVGFFLAGLVIHGGLQGWWLAPVITSLTSFPLFVGSVILTSFNDNAAITYLASQVPDLSASLKYAVLTGAVTGGGLTVIANAPNPAGQAILGRFFGGGVSPMKLAAAALLPTVVVSAFFLLLPDRGIEETFNKPAVVEQVVPGEGSNAPSSNP